MRNDRGAHTADRSPVVWPESPPQEDHIDTERRTTRAAGVRGHHPSYVWCFIAFLYANMFSGAAGANLTALPVDRILLAFSLMLFFLSPDRPRISELRLTGFHVAALVLLLITVTSALHAGTLSTSFGFFALLDRLVVPVGIFCVGPLILVRRQDQILLIKALCLLGVYLGITAIGEILGPHAVVFPRYILDPNVGIGYGRARGPFLASEADGLTLLVCAFASMSLTRMFRGSQARIWPYVAVLSVAVSFFGAFLTLTRSIWLGCILSLVLVALTDRSLRRPIVALAVVAVIIVPVALTASSSLSSLTNGRAGDSRSLYDRRNTDAAAVRAIEAHPLTGIGWTTFITKSDQYVRQAPDYPITTTDIEVHNVALSRGAELGIPGLVAWLLMVILGPVRALWAGPRPGMPAWRSIAIGALAAWVVTLMTSPVPYPLPTTLMFLVTGIAGSPYFIRPSAFPEHRADAELAPA